MPPVSGTASASSALAEPVVIAQAITHWSAVPTSALASKSEKSSPGTSHRSRAASGGRDPAALLDSEDSLANAEDLGANHEVSRRRASLTGSCCGAILS